MSVLLLLLLLLLMLGMALLSDNVDLEIADANKHGDIMTSSTAQHPLEADLATTKHLLATVRPLSCSGTESSPEPPHELHLPVVASAATAGLAGSASGSSVTGRLDTPIEELLEEDDDAALEPVMVKLDITRKQCPSLVVEGFKFTRSRSSHAGPSTFWRCSKRTCRATATSWDDDGSIVSRFGEST